MKNNSSGLKKISPVVEVPDGAIGENYTRGALEAYIRGEIGRYPEAEGVVPAFWRELVAIIGDEPGRTWDMRWGSKRHFCPVIYSASKPDEKPEIVAYILTGNGIRIEIKKDVLPKKYEALFPLKDSMFGECRAADFDYAEFGESEQKEYLDLFRAIHSISLAE